MLRPLDMTRFITPLPFDCDYARRADTVSINEEF